MHQRGLPLSRHSHARSGSATGTRTGHHARVRPGTAAEEKSRSVVCRTQESDRTTPPTPAATEVRARAVLPGGGCPEPQTTRPLPQPRPQSHPRCDHLTKGRKETNNQHHLNTTRRVSSLLKRLFQHPRLLSPTIDNEPFVTCSKDCCKCFTSPDLL